MIVGKIVVDVIVKAIKANLQSSIVLISLSFKKDFAEAYFNRANTYTKLLDTKKACTDLKKSAEFGYEPAKAHINNICN